MNEIEIPLGIDRAGVVKSKIDVDGFIIFELVSSSRGDQLRESLRTTDIITATSFADNSARTWPGIKFYLYSGVTGKWYAYFKPIEGAM